MDLNAVFAALPHYLAGAALTLQLLLAALLLGGAAALPLAVARGAASPWVHGPVWAFTYAIRGTPLLVQLFLLYYGLAQFEAVRASVFWPWLRSPAFCAVAAFAINTCAYTTEILHGTLCAVPAGEVEAARALGMTPFTTLRRIVLPAALRRALPAYGNEVVLMLHGTALASVVTLHELTGAARDFNSVYYRPFEAFITAAVLYGLITAVLVALFRGAERRWLQPMQRPQ
ncbi:histidine/lysine/arginine/ornithine transporter subunit; membrane component of ABC superfamily [Rubrivivax sp. A210]|uniref:ABC transporter permease n=1 Tax=Rubrivivax sp. A210 TaxID=2772301 RepID=UPI00191802F3|nr:ABC transporter permease [Rubrivivax sp. A210]CAD5375141.1 histidine/lysine/arginine/ornithine transporter subunit; membrane component of ABC superfamily [Rubrivivax sp. A210]